MTDQEILELAAKAYANPNVKPGSGGFIRIIGYNEAMDCDVMVVWNPLTDDGDALRLAVKIELEINTYMCAHWGCGVYITGSFWRKKGLSGNGQNDYEEPDSLEKRMTIVRRAITRAAAEIGRALP